MGKSKKHSSTKNDIDAHLALATHTMIGMHHGGGTDDTNKNIENEKYYKLYVKYKLKYLRAKESKVNNAS